MIRPKLPTTCIRKTEDKNWGEEGWNNFGKKREEITLLNISEQDLAGDLELKGFVNLKELDCFGNNITSLKIIGSPNLEALDCSRNKIIILDVSNFPKLERLNCYQNSLTKLDLNQNENLEGLDISDNNFPTQDLSFLSHLVNLEKLEVQNDMVYSFKRNRFSGSLEPLKELIQLERLNIKNTDIESGLEYLPFELTDFSCSAEEGENAKVKKLETELKKFNKDGEVVDL
jgi:Leucine-rich repeat (LRR) protein